MAYLAVELEVAVLEVPKAYKALGVVLQLYEYALGGDAVDDPHMVLSKMGAHVFGHIAVLRIPLAGDGPDLVLGALDGRLLGEGLIPLAYNGPVLATDIVAEYTVDGGVGIAAYGGGEVAVL